MDRSKWEYKKLGEVATFIGGGTPSKAKEEYYTGNIPWATVRDMTNFCLSQTELSITEQAVKESATNIIPKDTIIISTHVGLGKICLLMQDTAINQDLKGVILPSTIDKMYFAAWYKSISEYIVSNGKGATVKGVTMKFVNDLSIPLPPVADQQRIVAELDCLNEMIAVKQEQLKEFDKLAQSIFYDMFGDPVTNEKGWEVRNLGDLLNIPSRNGLSKPTAIRGKGVPMISMGEMFANPIITDNVKATLVPVTERELETSQIVSGDLLFARQSLSLEGAGKCSFVKSCSQPTVFESHLIRIRVNENVVLGKYVFCYFQTPCGIAEVRKRVYQVAAAGIKGSELIKIPIPLPPLSLQQQFADKISAIEAQKELVKQSIAETQALLDYTMDKYFG